MAEVAPVGIGLRREFTTVGLRVAIGTKSSPWFEQDLPKPGIVTLEAGKCGMLSFQRESIERVRFPIKESGLKTTRTVAFGTIQAA